MRRLYHGLLATLLAVALVPATAAGTVPPPFEARYELRKGPLTVGEALMSFKRPGDGRYLYRLHTRPVGLTRLVYSGEVREVSEGRIVAGGFRPERYRYNRSGDDRAREAELRFDWEAGEATHDATGGSRRMAITADTLDRAVSPLQLMHDLDARGGDTPLTYTIAEGGELKTYRLEVEGRETVRVPAGRFEALRVIRHDSGGDRVIRLWCAPELDYLAVQVEQWEDGERDFRLALAGLEGIHYKRQPSRPRFGDLLHSGRPGSGAPGR